MKKRTKILWIALVLAAIATLVIGTAVFADAPGNGVTQEYCNGTGWHGANGIGGACSDTVADLLGLTQEELHELRLEGKSLAEIAENNGISVDDLVDAIIAEKVAAVTARVQEGTLTREQANLMIERMEERTYQAVNRTTVGPAEWSRGGNRMNGSGACGSGAGSANRWGGQDNTETGSRFGSGMGRMTRTSY
jgi:hypothetical protein